MGSYVAQAFARKYPGRLLGLFFFHCVYPGIGKRWLDPDSAKEIWYQSFNQQPWAASLVGRDRTTCMTYFRHFLDHWAGRPGLFDEDLDAWVDNFMKPGNLQGGFNWYIGIDEARTGCGATGRRSSRRSRCLRAFSGARRTLVKISWADRLGEYFSDYSFAAAEGAGHFVHYESLRRPTARSPGSSRPRVKRVNHHACALRAGSGRASDESES